DIGLAIVELHPVDDSSPPTGRRPIGEVRKGICLRPRMQLQRRSGIGKWSWGTCGPASKHARRKTGPRWQDQATSGPSWGRRTPLSDLLRRRSSKKGLNWRRDAGALRKVENTLRSICQIKVLCIVTSDQGRLQGGRLFVGVFRRNLDIRP